MQHEKHWHLYSLGLVEYQKALRFQEKLTALRWQQKLPDSLILLEHPHTYTLGPKSKQKHFFVNAERIGQGEVEVHHVDRGGEITYHGPGQLVGYPIMQLESDAKQVGFYIRKLEDMLLATLHLCGLQGRKKSRQAAGKSMTGVWVNDEKIASIGIKVDRNRITSHGFALNINTDLDYFQHIIPCGMKNCHIVSIAELKGHKVSMEEIENHLTTAFAKVFDAEFIRQSEKKIA